MKVLNLTKMNKKDQDNALNEPEILKKVQHRNLVNFVEDFRAQDPKFNYLCIVTQFIEGKTVEDLI